MIAANKARLQSQLTAFEVAPGTRPGPGESRRGRNAQRRAEDG
jgi:hypothetical protein